jgi:hypothetical protein
MPDVPTIFESLHLDQEQQWWLDFREDLRKIGRLLITPPGVDGDKLSFLRRISKEILTDPKYPYGGGRLALISILEIAG